MRKIVILSLVILSIMLAACNGDGELNVPVNINGDGDGGVIEELLDEVPRIEATPTPPLPPTFTPAAMAHQGHLYLLPVSGADGSVQYAHKVRTGDTLAALCDMYDVSVKDVMLINDITDANHIEVGQLIIIPIEGY